MTDHIARHAAPKTLVEGQRLDQPAFHLLCKAMPAGSRAETIERMAYQ
jgi:hypothetical protein